MKYLILMVAGFILSSCTNAGPYITNISRTKDEQLLVEKCMLNHNAWMGTVSNENCTTQVI